MPSARPAITSTLAFALICASLSASRAADRFVSTSGADAANDCLVGTSPCRTVAHGLAQAASGDTVKVASGTYHENLLVDTSTTVSISGGWSADFAAQDPAANPTTLDGGRVATVVTVLAGAGETLDVTVDGLTVTHGFGPSGGVDVRAVADGSASVTVSRCTVRSNKGQPISNPNCGGGIGAYAKDSASVVVAVTDSIVMSNSVPGTGGGIVPFVVAAGGIAALSRDMGQLTFSVAGSTVTRNRGLGGGIDALARETSEMHVAVDDSIVFRNRGAYDGGGIGAYAVSVEGASLGLSVSGSVVTRNRQTGGIVCTSVVPCTLTNTIVSNHSGIAGRGEGVRIYDITVAALVNTTVSNNPRGGVRMFGGGLPVLDVTNSILWNNHVAGDDLDVFGVFFGTTNLRNSDIGTVSSGGSTVNDLGGNISVDPQLTTPASGLRLTAGSPCIDTGTCTGAPATDIDGDPRPTGGGCDMGADEFVP
jgi:hypothetical protein